MATIFDYLSRSNCQRPVYTSYELSNLVKKKRKEEGISLEECAQRFGISTELLSKVENIKGTFTPKMYRACSAILNLSVEDILKVDNDETEVASYRADADSSEVSETVQFANQLFNEIIMQRKIGIR